MKNPYSLDHIWPPEVLAAYKDMPLYRNKLAPVTKEFLPAWREWFKRTPKHLWNPEILRRCKLISEKKEHGSETLG